jgi:RNA ligase (TIGR02306 family)
MPRKQVVGFPYWVSKTDEERIQNIPQVLNDFKDELVYITEKVDYQSATFTGKLLPNTFPVIGKYLPKKFKFIVCSRNLINNDKSSLYWQIAEKYNLEKILKENPTLTIQGEQGNSKVQGNKYGISEPKIWIFNIFDHEKNYYYDYWDMVDFCNKYSLTPVPFISQVKLSNIATTVDEMVEYSKGKSAINNKINREGVVVRRIKDGRKLLSYKTINPDFLLKYDGD